MLELTLVIAVALAFDFTNGFHDAANAIATSVTTKSINPRLAVFLAGLLNFAGAFISLKVATTIGKGIINPGSITLHMILAGLVGAIAWNLITWWYGLPSSSSQALVGGVAGAAIAGGGGLAIVNWSGIYHKVLIPSLVAPVLGFTIAAALVLVLSFGLIRRYLSAHPTPARGLQLVSAGFVALTHGTNDAQKTMGVIALALVAGGQLATFSVPTWVIVCSGLAMGLGTYAGGWRIVRTLGSRIHALDLRHGTSAQTAAGVVLATTAHYGYPVSTTHTISGSIMGTGAEHRFRATEWSTVKRIGFAWLTTIPVAAAIGAVVAEILRVPGASVVVGAGLLALLGIAWHWRGKFFGGAWIGETPTEPAPLAH